MAYLSLQPVEQGIAARFAAMLAECGAILELVGAAIRVSRAIEHRRAPAAQDLKRLGVRRPFPGTV